MPKKEKPRRDDRGEVEDRNAATVAATLVLGYDPPATASCKWKTGLAVRGDREPLSLTVNARGNWGAFRAPSQGCATSQSCGR